jgi:hypothetical protein
MQACPESAVQAQTPRRRYSEILATAYRRCAEGMGLAADWDAVITAEDVGS